MRTKPAQRLLALAGGLGALSTGFLLLARPWTLRWGATDDEVTRALPGDDIVPDARGQETRAITVRAPVEKVWPWLAQTGQDRGGFYSFDLLENLVGCQMPEGDVLRPEKQRWRLGDKLWMYPREKAGGGGFATLETFVPGRALGFGTRAMSSPPDAPYAGSWSFVAEPLGSSTTRLLVRGRGARGRSLLGRAFDQAIFEPVHFVMERRMMVGIKQLAEGGSRHRRMNDLQVLLWAVTFGLFVTAGVQVLRRERWHRPLAGLVGAGTVFQVLTLVQPPVRVGLVLVSSLAALLGWPDRARPRPSNARQSHATSLS